MNPNPLGTAGDLSNGGDVARILVIGAEAGAVVAEFAGDLGEITVVANGNEGLDALQRYVPELVLLDSDISGASAADTCKAIKNRPGLTALPILFLTHLADSAGETQAFELGAADFISKPLNRHVVRARLQTQIALRQQASLLQRLTVVDIQTGIPNRRTFDQALEQECRRACRSGTVLSLLMIDIDYFKLFNDHYGHQAGDDCLRRIGGTLASCVHRPGEVVARYGGEEFAMVLPICEKGDALGLAEKARAAVAALQIPNTWSKVIPFVTISVGVASVDFTLDVDETGPVLVADALRESVLALIQTADGALYDAKRGGRNQVAWSEAPAR